MDKKTLPVLLPVRSVIFPLIFIAGAAMTGKNVSDISNWWSTAADRDPVLVLPQKARSAADNDRSRSHRRRNRYADSRDLVHSRLLRQDVWDVSGNIQSIKGRPAKRSARFSFLHIYEL